MYEQAIPPLTRVLEFETNTASPSYNMALNYRAVANLRAGRFQDAKRDAETLQKAFPTASQVYFVLGEVAYTNRLTNVALRNYELYLTNAPNNPDEIKKVSDRMKELRPGYP
jgi:tetratricopeptide (TPR) repeat protein